MLTTRMAVALALVGIACSGADDKGASEGDEQSADGASGADGTAGADGGDPADDSGDGDGDGGSNSPPTAATVALSPMAPTTNDDLTVVILADGADPEGAPVSYRYVWFQDGVVRGDLTESVLPASETAKGQIWLVSVVASDGTVDGGVATAEVQIANAPPSAPAVEISPAEPSERSALVCSLLSESSDDDGDEVDYTFTWEVDRAPFATTATTTHRGDTIEAGSASVGEWVCSVVADDGESTSEVGEARVDVIASICGEGTVTHTSSGIEFVTICAGTFDMGCTPGQSSCASDESPVRTTTLTRDYYLSRTEITQAQFESVLGYNPADHTRCGGTCPAESFTWNQGAAFANAVSAAEGLDPCYSCTGVGTTVTCTAPASPYECTGYRYPSEAEWEGAARCGDDTLYVGGNTLHTLGWYSWNSGGETHPVAEQLPNLCGLYDMTGNVTEYMGDWYVSNAYLGGAATDPVGAASGTDRSLRGGAYYNSPTDSRLSARSRLIPNYQSLYTGMRLARSKP